MSTVNPQAITLEWVCNNDDEHEGADDQVITHQNLADVPEVGGAICPQCGEDMELIGADIAGGGYHASAG